MPKAISKPDKRGKPKKNSAPVAKVNGKAGKATLAPTKSAAQAKTKIKPGAASPSVPKSSSKQMKKPNSSLVVEKVAEKAKKLEKITPVSQETKTAPKVKAEKEALRSPSQVKTPVAELTAEAKLKAKAQKDLAKKATAEKAYDKSANPKWITLFEKSKGKAATPYDMKMQYEPKTAIEHKVLGWGYILSNRNDRLEVIFKDGIRYLISNYK